MQLRPIKKILDAVVATGAGVAINVGDLRNLVLALNTTGLTDATIKIQGSIQQDEPNWTGAQSADNIWDYIQLRDLEDASAIDGDTGIVLAGAADNRLLAVNTDHLVWVNVRVTAWAVGEINASLAGASE